ncbi:ABC transporter substrate-binding protein [Pseudoscardovia radai]|uniref:ABC transporter substrate-binding protein n=1 Tax=Pseudoscardovia radai TaxID=987066 RepID=A0A261F008_9BIFI|nr:ABC transporter substrate-binding protein [Pseudoscardovia radai]
MFTACLIVFGFAAWLVWGMTVSHNNPVVRRLSGATGASVTIAVDAVPSSLDVHTDSEDAVAQYLVGNVYETICGRNASNNAVAGLATSWETSEDGLTYTFHLADGIRFSNGHTLDASDVVWSLQQTVQNAYLGSDALAGLASVTQTDASTVTITLSTPDPTLPWRLSGRAGIVWDEEDQGDGTTPVAGSGPYVIGALDAGQTLTLERNDAYWASGHTENPRTVTLRAYADGQSAVEDVKNGTVDAVLPADSDALASLDGVEGVSETTMGSTMKTAIAFHSGGQTYFADVASRQAARKAIDTAGIVSWCGATCGTLSEAVAPLDPGAGDISPAVSYDPQSSRAFFSSLAMNLSFVYRESDAAVAQQAIAQLSAAGWWVFGTQLDDASYERQVTQEHDYDMTIVHFDDSRDISRISDPNGVAQYTSSEADELRARLAAATNGTDYANDVAALADRLDTDSPYVWLYVSTPVAASRSTLTGMPALYSSDRLDLTALHVN